MNRGPALAAVLLLSFVVACQTAGQGTAEGARAARDGGTRTSRSDPGLGRGGTLRPDGSASDARLNAVQSALVDSAGRLEGFNGSEITVRDRTFPMDCTGVVLALYYNVGIDLTAEFGSYSGNGVSRLYQYLDDNRLVYQGASPALGDLVFWDNTYDRNENREFDDPLTHVGMVVRREADGTIVFVHHHYRDGVVFAQMNLDKRDSWDHNVPMRMRGAEPRIENRILASQILKAFGSGWMLEG